MPDPTPEPLEQVEAELESGRLRRLAALKEKVRILAAAREKAVAAKLRLAAELKKFNDTHAGLLQAAKEAASLEAAADEDLRKSALQTYAVDKNPLVAPGVSIMKKNVLTYDRARALAYAIEKRQFLDLNAKAFDAAMKNEKVLPEFVEREEVASVRVAENLPTIEPEPAPLPKPPEASP